MPVRGSSTRPALAPTLARYITEHKKMSGAQVEYEAGRQEHLEVSQCHERAECW